MAKVCAVHVIVWNSIFASLENSVKRQPFPSNMAENWLIDAYHKCIAVHWQTSYIIKPIKNSPHYISTLIMTSVNAI